ncbi:hypothetical protein GCM10009838_20230 [Catenulispora subtropica]|uniref:non-specific serine/threonine protein kinase n=1 Tax=Catenulispora subtropica TaxID=450798 RepID=A0ABN2R3U7_9ACTN
MDAGEVLGERYRLKARLGRGGMGEVWAAYDEQLRRDIAVKIVLAELGADPRLLASLKQEARTVAALQHAGITVVHDVGETDGHPYFVMEHLEGRTFEQLLKDHPQGLPADRAVSLMVAVADALDYAHGRGVVHRDIKPANLMCLAGDSVKILDFGIASYAEATVHVTSTGVIMGSPPYMPPEVWLGEKATPAADMYAFGATLHALLTGAYPFPGPTPAAWMRQHLDVPPPRLKGNSAHLDDLIQQLLAKDHDKRPSAAHTRQVLAQIQKWPEKQKEPLGTKKSTASGTKDTVPYSAAAAVTEPALPSGQESTASGESRRAPMNWIAAGVGSLLTAIGIVALITAPFDHSITSADLPMVLSVGGGFSLAGSIFLWFSFQGQRFAKISAGVVAVLVAMAAGFTVYKLTPADDPQAKDLLQKIEVAKFMEVPTGQVLETDYKDTLYWQGNGYTSSGSARSSSQHIWGDDPGDRVKASGGSWYVLVDMYHYSSTYDATADSTTFIKEHSGQTYRPAAAPAGMTAMTATATDGSRHTQAMEIVDGTFRVRLELDVDAASNKPDNDINSLAELIFQRLPAPAGK